MLRQIITIFILMLAIGGVGYYGYTLYLKSDFSSTFLDGELAFLDQGMSELDAFSMSEAEVADVLLEEQTISQTDTIPLKTSDLDALIKDLDSASTVNYNATPVGLSDL